MAFKSQVKIAPSILASDFSRLREQIKSAEDGQCDWIHLDIMDGHFVPNISFGPPVVASVRTCTKLTLDTHLMISDPDRYLEAFREAGADRITVHQEACTHLNRTLNRIRELGAKSGVAINPATPVSLLTDVLGDVDLILVMTVNPGFGGQEYLPATEEKILQLRSMIDSSGRSIELEVDGGIDPATAPRAVAAGATVLVAGTSVFRQKDIPAAIQALRKAV